MGKNEHLHYGFFYGVTFLRGLCLRVGVLAPRLLGTDSARRFLLVLGETAGDVVTGAFGFEAVVLATTFCSSPVISGVSAAFHM